MAHDAIRNRHYGSAGLGGLPAASTLTMTTAFSFIGSTSLLGDRFLASDEAAAQRSCRRVTDPGSTQFS